MYSTFSTDKSDDVFQTMIFVILIWMLMIRYEILRNEEIFLISRQTMDRILDSDCNSVPTNVQ